MPADARVAPPPGAAAVEHANTRAAGRQLVGDGAADDAGAHDGDVHIAILVG